jgi:NADPH:quinone reductase
MLAACYSRPGPATSVLEVIDVERPDPAPGEVLVRVAVSGVNPTDWKARAARPDRISAPFQIPNQDGAGVIEAVGAGVDRGRIGERVWVYFAAWQRRWGTAAQYTVVPEQQAVPLPDGVSEDIGASLGIPVMTAHRCLFADGAIEGKTVLVAGGAGAVGRAAIELARWGGARVVTTVSSDDKARVAREAGAHAVVAYRDEDAVEQLRAAAPDGVHRVVEVAPSANLELNLAGAAPNAVISAYAADASGELRVPVMRLMSANIVLRFVLVYTLPHAAIRAAVDDITAALRAGAISAPPFHRFPLARTAGAHDAVEAGAVGKVLIDVP